MKQIKKDNKKEKLDRVKEVAKNFFDRQITQTKECRTLTLADGTKTTRPFSYKLTNYVAIIIVFAVFWRLIVGDYFRKVPFTSFVNRLPNFFDILKRMVTEFSVPYFPRIFLPIIDTIQMAILGTAIGALFALPVAFLASSNVVKNKYITNSIKFVLSFVRTLPTLVYAAVLAFAFGFGTLVGVMATSIFTFGILTKMLFEVIETLDLGSFMAIEATGANKAKAFITSVIPQIMGTFLSFTLYSFEINIRASAILGFVGAGGIGILINENMSWRRYGNIGVILVSLFVVVMIIENTSRYLRKRLS